MAEVEKRITPEQAMRMLKKQGVEISVKQTEEVSKLLRTLSEIAVSQYLLKIMRNTIGYPTEVDAG